MRLEMPATGLTGAVSTARPNTARSSPSNGNSPANSQYASTPKEYTSADARCGYPIHCSGDLYPGVPLRDVSAWRVRLWLERIWAASPKSSTFTPPSSSTMTFSGFTSR